MQILKSPAVSVVVPAWQSEKTIGRCLTSLREQTFSDIEIIVIDDGSTDSTGDVVIQAAEMDSRIKYHYQENQGVSVARNLGIDRASGKYLMFLDSDDHVRRDYVERLVMTMSGDDRCDLAICSYDRRIHGCCVPVERLIRGGKRSGKEYLEETLIDPGHHYFGVVWNKIFRMGIIKSHNIRFREGITLGEDFVFSLDYLAFVKSVYVITDRLVVYCYQQQSSLSRVIEKKPEDCRDEMENRNKIFKFYHKTLEHAGIAQKNRKKIYQYWIMFEIHQMYGLNHEYHWNEDVKRSWKNEIMANLFIKEAHSYFSDKEVMSYYRKYALGQIVRRSIKKAMIIIEILKGRKGQYAEK
ncbi:Glycosyl transferase family 2 [Lachnospiraceae bacterium]|nr:Glycosyl transferase family 2 [Lachnospiraceae bacterium]